MNTVAELAREFGFAEIYAFRVWADDLLDGVKDDSGDVPAEIEAQLREAYVAQFGATGK